LWSMKLKEHSNVDKTHYFPPIIQNIEKLTSLTQANGARLSQEKSF